MASATTQRHHLILCSPCRARCSARGKRSGWPMPETSADRGASAARARRKPIEIIHEGSF
ncbi:MAG: hypothetical protein EB089_02720 [Acidimicrobiia bacterium]|nr:hypothetical protein [Acidimicrobiia bacterium]NDD72047.1 hypothetical protein [Actinomycetota bacterium]